MMRAYTEYNGNAHTTQGTGQCMVTHDDTRLDLFIVVRITLFTVNFKSTSIMMRAVRILRGNRGNLHGTDGTCHLIY